VLSMVNAIPHGLHKRDTEFLQCPKGAPLEVSISPNPPEAGKETKFDITGNAPSEIPQDASVIVAFVNLDSTPDKPSFIGQPFAAQLCGNDVQCPIPTGNQYKKSVDVKSPDSLPTAYVIVVAVADKDKKVLGCAYAVVGDVKVSPATLVARFI